MKDTSAMTGFQITCANKNTQGVIVRVGGPGWSLEAHEAIMRLITHRVRLYILLGNTHYDIGVRGAGAHAYLALEPDGRPLADIDMLPSC